MKARLSDWSDWMMYPERIIDGSTAEQACDFVNKYPEDVKLLQALGLKAFRLSLNWPALLGEEPSSPNTTPELNAEAVEYYRRLLTQLKEQGIVTFVTLFHFCLPFWLAQKGGWLNPISADQFRIFTVKIVDALGDLVDYWLTINEPMAYAYQSYIAGVWTPGLKSDYLSAFTSVKNMLTGHAMAYEAIKSKFPNSPVSYTNHWRPFSPEKPLSILDHMVCTVRDNVFNHLFPSSINSGIYRLPPPLGWFEQFRALEGPITGLKDSIDYLGINYYTRELSRFKPSWPIDFFGEASDKPQLKTNALGWEVYPEGLYQILTHDVKPYLIGGDGKIREIFITENGYAERFESQLEDGDWSLDDQERVHYLTGHLKAIHDAIEAGSPVRGYLYWSLLDNFEWAEGLCQRFGLVRVSYPNQARAPRQSAYVYADIAVSNCLSHEILSKHKP